MTALRALRARLLRAAGLPLLMRGGGALRFPVLARRLRAANLRRERARLQA